MTWKHYLLLAIISLAVLSLAAAFQSAPGYMDADYYYAGGLQLVHGHGFTEPYLWNYLDNPAGLPHPSNAYWMPLASLLAAGGATLFGPGSWTAARLGFIIVAALVPPVTAALAWTLTSRRDLALASGLLAAFPAFYLPFLGVTDTFGLYMLLGGLFFLVAARREVHKPRPSFWLASLVLGLLAGLMHLTRADGILWLVLALAVVFLFPPETGVNGVRWRGIARGILLTLAGYLLVMLPWFIRNVGAFGAPLGPGGTKMLWLTTYDQIFAYPPGQLTLAAWWQSGLASILKARLWALGVNLERTLAEQGEIFLLPLILVALWHFRRQKLAWLAGLAWLLTLAAMTAAFPFAGARGGFFHSGAALQPVWWALAPVGLDRAIEWGRRRRGWDARQAGKVFQPALVILAVAVTAAVAWSRLAGGAQSGPSTAAGAGQQWSQENIAYSQISNRLDQLGALPADVVLVANPPGYYLAGGNSAIAVPDGSLETLMEVARKFGASYLVLEQGSVPAALESIFDHPEAQPGLVYLGEEAGGRIFLIQSH